MLPRKPWEGLVIQTYKHLQVDFRLTPDLWLAQDSERVLAVNVITGRRLLLAPEDLDEMVKFCTPRALKEPLSPLCERLVQADILTTEDVDKQLLFDLKRPLRKALQRYVADTLQTTRSKVQKSCPTDAALADFASKTALRNSKSQAKETVRDLSSLFRNAKTALESDPRGSDYHGHFLANIWERPNSEDQFGQLPCLPESSLARVRTGLEAVKKPELTLILGDDDLLSLAWIAVSVAPCHTFELDSRLLEHLRQHQTGNLELFQRDLTQGLPKSHRRRYSLIFSDPPYNKEGMDLFLTCCSQGLSDDPNARVLLSTRPDLIEEGEQLKDRLNKLDFVVEEQRVDFSRYLWPRQLAKRAFDALRPSGLPTHLLSSLLNLPLYHSDLLVLRRKSQEPGRVE